MEQSLLTILGTPKGSRVMRREFGLVDIGLIDAPMNEQTITDAFQAIAEAIEPREINGHQYGEPRFDLIQILPSEASKSGRIVFDLAGLHYPRGHLGDFTVVEVASTSFVLSAA